MRRIGYPAFGSLTGKDITDEGDTYTPEALPAGQLYTPIQINANLGNAKLLQRWPYPESSSSRNSNTPSYKGDGTAMFWAE